MKTRIIVDSTADLVPEIKERVYTVPLTVHFGQEEYIDGVTIDNKTFYEKLVESDVLPTTSQAAPNDFIKEFEKAKQAGEASVVITLASRFSGTYQSAVIAAADYDPEADPDNTPDSVFCAHGGGFTVKWDKVPEYMHLPGCLEKPREDAPVRRRCIRLDDAELEAIMTREFGPVRRPLYRAPEKREAPADTGLREIGQRCYVVDGYNVIFAWEDLAAQAKDDLDAARRQLCDRLSSYAGFTKCRLVVVFDGYKQKGNPGEKSQFHNIQVVYTKEGQTADAYIEALAHEIGRDYTVRVASSDGLVQLSSFGSGVLRMSARELHEEVEAARAEMRKHYRK